MKLQQRRPSWILPARSTVYDLLRPYGVIKKQRRRRPVGHPGKPQRQASAPNDIWCADFKGEFRLGNGEYCYPLTVTDQYSRYLLVCQALPSTALEGVKPVFHRIFREFGLPRFIRSDNGSPFAANSLARLSSLSAWWIQLGVLPDLIEPGKPQQNGRHERMHRTLKDETTRPAANTFQGQQRKFNVFVEEFNDERPHEALDMQTPASQYTSSSRPMPSLIVPFGIPIISKCATSALTAAFVGTIVGSTFHRPVVVNTSVSKRSIISCGMFTTVRSSLVAFTNTQ